VTTLNNTILFMRMCTYDAMMNTNNFQEGTLKIYINEIM
jgi:hypothetical protein